MASVNLHELKAHLSAYARRVKAGETVIVCERNVPIAELRPIPAASPVRRPAPGMFKDQIDMDDSFFLADEELSGDFLEER